jgi:VIT1/CCC1 family predicted Fe2+/Mn2+ transporter
MDDASGGARPLNLWREHWQDEGDAAHLYRRIAAAEPDPARARVYRELAAVEDQHVARWAAVLREAGVRLPPHRPSLRARIMILIGRLLGWRLLAGLLLAEEGRETKGYLRAARHYAPEAARTAAELAKESAEHAERLGALLGVSGEPWHRIESGGFLRNAVYGFNDGLTANFGLVMGVLGADVPHHIVLVSGVAGLIADALSMGSSGFLAAKSEQEVQAHEVAVEREELRLMPDLEEVELALLYRSRGLGAEAAQRAAREVMLNPELALAEKTQLELGITPRAMSPLREGWITGLATAVGAFIPVLPFLALEGRAAVATSFVISMLSHFGVGAARSVFTGRGAFRSGLDMFIVGLGIAVIGYLVGEWISRVL